MKQMMKNEKGITLIELLAVLAIGSVILSLIIGVTVNGQKTYSQQANSAEQLTEVRYVVKVITKELRKAERLKVEEDQLTIFHDTPLVFRLQDGRVWQNGSVLAEHIGALRFELDGRTISIVIETEQARGRGQEAKVEIYLRDGVEIEQ